MRRPIRNLIPLAAALLVAWASPGLAGVFVQCPTLSNPSDPGSVVYTGSFSDINGDGLIRAADNEIVNPVSPTQVCMHLAAGDGWTSMADGREQYIFGFANATGDNDDMVMHMYMFGAIFPAPTIKVKQGDDVYLTLTNVGMANRPDLFDPHTVHWHGFPNAASIFDGVPDASISINMGASLTYYYKVQESGTFMYHCHVEATEHMQMGMLGNLYVTPVQDGTSHTYPPDTGRTYTKFAYNDGDGSTGYDVDYPIQIAAFDPAFHDASRDTQPLPFALMDDKYPMLNGRGYPDTVEAHGPLPHEHGNAAPMSTLIEATAGQRILLRISSLSTTSFHTLTVQGIPMQVVGRGSRKLGPANDTSQYYNTSSITIGGGQAVDVILDTTGLTPGSTYFLHTAQLDHLANNDEDFGGMMTEIRIQ